MALSSNLKEIWGFMRTRKKWWLMPLVIVLLVFGAIMVFAQSSVISSFIYTIF